MPNWTAYSNNKRLSDFLNNETGFVQHEFEHVLSHYKEKENVLITHHGKLSQDVISNIETKVETIVTDLEIPKGPLKKIFFISVETLQNILIHGQKGNSGEQPNYFFISKNGVAIHIVSANLIANKDIKAIENHIAVINGFEDEKALKSYYLEHLENNSISDKGGAGLGFITIGMKSGNKLKTDFKKINEEYSLFQLTTTINLV